MAGLSLLIYQISFFALELWYNLHKFDINISLLICSCDNYWLTLVFSSLRLPLKCPFAPEMSLFCEASFWVTFASNLLSFLYLWWVFIFHLYFLIALSFLHLSFLLPFVRSNWLILFFLFFLIFHTLLILNLSLPSNTNKKYFPKLIFCFFGHHLLLFYFNIAIIFKPDQRSFDCSQKRRRLSDQNLSQQ